jgi:4-diphosphocytidyl-2-C-methyl-D-erythritol kinase
VSTLPLAARAPGKTNLCLYLGETRADGLHRLVSVVESLSLADELTLSHGEGADEVVCPGVEGPNLAAAALAAYREATGWDGPPLRLEIVKRVPVAAGMGGGSGDAAAALRLAAAAAGDPADERLAALAPRLGADVPSQVEPGTTLLTGAGEEVRPLPALPEHALLVLPSPHALPTAEVYAEADRLGLSRDPGDLNERRVAVEAWLEHPRELRLDLIVNDLELAALSLLPAIDDALADARAAGAAAALVSGSGPTVVGVFPGPDGEAAARAAAEELAERHPGATAAVPVDATFAAPRPAGA